MNEYVALLPLKGRGGLEDGHEVMDGAVREEIWLKRTEVTFSIIHLREVKGKRT